MDKKSKLPNLVSILILTVLTSIMWISFSVYRAVTTKPAANVSQVISEPLTPTLDTETINKIESSLYLGSDQIPQSIVTQTIVAPTPTNAPVVSPEPTSQPTLEPSPTPEPTVTP